MTIQPLATALLVTSGVPDSTGGSADSPAPGDFAALVAQLLAAANPSAAPSPVPPGGAGAPGTAGTAGTSVEGEAAVAPTTDEDDDSDGDGDGEVSAPGSLAAEQLAGALPLVLVQVTTVDEPGVPTASPSSPPADAVPAQPEAQGAISVGDGVGPGASTSPPPSDTQPQGQSPDQPQGQSPDQPQGQSPDQSPDQPQGQSPGQASPPSQSPPGIETIPSTASPLALSALTSTVAPAPALVAADAPAAARPSSPVAQVVPEVIRLVSGGNGVHRLTMRLQPEALGEVRVTLTVRDGAVQVSLTGGAAAARALAEGAPELRRVLELAGAGEARVVVRDLAGHQPATAGHQPVAGSGTHPGAQDTSYDARGGTAGDTSSSFGGDTGQQDHHARTREGAGAMDGLTDGASPLRPAPVTAARQGIDLTM